jgi:GAF domain-containing protein
MKIGPSRGRQKRFLTWQAGTAAVSLSAAAAYALQVVIGGTLPTWGHWTLLAGGVLCTFGGSAIAASAAHRETAARRNAEEIAKEASREAQVAMRGYLIPALDGLLRIAHDDTHEGRREKQERTKQLVIDVMSSIRPDARACFFALHPGPPRTLRCDGVWNGGNNRNHPPRSEFKEGDKGAGDDLFKMLDDPQHPEMFIRDGDAEHPKGWETARDYKTYISMPVAASSTIFGFVGLDAPIPNSLTDDDLNTVRLLARILSAALAITR